MAVATAGRAFDPNRTYPLVLSERLKKEQTGAHKEDDEDYELSTVHIDPELKLPVKVTSAQIKPSSRNDDESDIHLKGAKDGEDYKYSGVEQKTEGITLLFDAATQTMILDRVDKSYNFTNEQAGEGSQSDPSDDGMLTALIEQEGEPDPDNPYDWRHQLTAQRESSSPEPFDPISLDALGSPSPDARPRRMSRRQASTPPSPQSSFHASPEAERSEQEFELEIEQDEPRRKQTRREEEEEEADSEGASEDEGGLQIIMDGSSERPKFNHRGRLLGNLDGDGPISLRSAANSRSPAIQAHDIQSDDSDEDVDVMQLNSPAQQAAPASQQPEEDADMDGGFSDLEEDLEKEFDQDGNDDEDGGEEATGGVPIGRYVEASSSESEEE